MSSTPKAPPHLSPAMRTFWRDTISHYQLEPHHLRLLEGACSAWDRAEEARLILADSKPVIEDRFGQPKPHPATNVERDSRALFARLILQLGLDLDTQPAPRSPSRWRD